MEFMRIPKHARVEIIGNNNIGNMFNDVSRSIQCGLGADLTLDLRSDFSQMYSPPEGAISDLMTIVSNLSSNVKQNPNAKGLEKVVNSAADIGQYLSGKYKLFGLQIWKSTSPLDMNITLDFFSTYNAKKQVHEPVLELMKMPLPTENSNGMDSGQRENLKGLGLSKVAIDNMMPLIPPGPSIAYAFGATQEKGKNIIDISIGSYYFKDVFITSCSPTMNTQKMRVYDNEGRTNSIDYPISCTVVLVLRTIYIITSNYIKNITKQNTK